MLFRVAGDGTVRRMKTLFLTAVALLVSTVSPALAGAPTDALKQRVDRVVQILGEPGDHRAAIRSIAHETFDFEEMARRALGPHWNSRTPEERREFVPLFTDLLERSYIGRIEAGRGGTVAYVGESAQGDEATVRTRVTTEQRSEIPIDYRMHRKDGRWLVYDVNIEGVSLVNNYRSQFNSVIQSSSFAALLDRLRAKEPDAAASPAPAKRSRRD